MKFLASISFLIILFSCTTVEENKGDKTLPSSKNTIDSHSYSNHVEVKTKHLHLELEVNFENQTIYGVARHEMDKHNSDVAIFDMKGLKIKKVTLGNGNEIPTDYTIGKHDELLGSPLSVKISPDTKHINIYYQTSEES